MQKCDAPGCDNEVEPNEENTYRIPGEMWPFNHQYYCPACNERETSGRVSDHDPATNPDLEEKR